MKNLLEEGTLVIFPRGDRVILIFEPGEEHDVSGMVRYILFLGMRSKFLSNIFKISASHSEKEGNWIDWGVKFEPPSCPKNEF